MTTVIITRNGVSTALEKVVVKQKGETVPGLPFRVFFGEVRFVMETITGNVCILHEYRKWSLGKISSQHYSFTVGAGDTYILADAGLLERGGE